MSSFDVAVGELRVQLQSERGTLMDVPCARAVGAVLLPEGVIDQIARLAGVAGWRDRDGGICQVLLYQLPPDPYADEEDLT